MNSVVASVLVNGGRIGVFKRSLAVTGDRGRWHCVTGYLPARADPLRHAFVEVGEETGLGLGEVFLVRRGSTLVLRCTEGLTWHVVPFLFRTRQTDLELNWEHDAYRWVEPAELRTLDVVSWLADVLHAVREPEAASR